MSALLKKTEREYKMNEWSNPNLPLSQNQSIQKKRKSRKKTRKKPCNQKAVVPKRKFSDTSIAYYLKLYAPVEYDLIVESGGVEPTADFIESVSYSSINPFFKSMTFRQQLILYRKRGCRQRNETQAPTPEVIRHHMYRRKQMMSRL